MARKSMLYLLFLLFCVSSVFAGDSNDPNAYPNRLIESAKAKKLHEDPYWHILLHYPPKKSKTYESAIDDPGFFLSPKGKYDSEAELEATIRAFFNQLDKPEEHPVCKFVARFEWLKNQLSIDTSQLPLSSCQTFNNIIEKIKPESATIAFPTYFMNSPASMFGHTLLNIDTEYDSKLLSHAINYAALANETNGILFAFKGLFGFYKGYYSILPYYQKIQEYSDINQRDIWEYPTNMNKEEVVLMLRHMWELRDIYTRYYFFDENCSYNILYLLEAGRPSLKLREHFGAWVLPIDTIKAIKSEGLIDVAEYRPSKASKIKHKISLLDTKGQTEALDIIYGRKSPDILIKSDIPKDKKIRIMDLSVDFIRFQYAKKKLSIKDYRKVLMNTLKARSKLGKPDKQLYDEPLPPVPDDVHDTSRLSLGMGIDRDEVFQQIGYKPVFADILDTDYAPDQGIQAEFFDTRLRYYDSDNKLVLQKMDVIDIFSISAMNRFFMPVSWKVSTGVKRIPDKKCDYGYAAFLNTGAGLAFHDNKLGLGYLFIEPEVNIGDSLYDKYAIGLGVSAGWLKKLSPLWKAHFFARKLWFEPEDGHTRSEISLAQEIILEKNHHINFTVSWKEFYGHSRGEGILAWHVYF